MQARKWKCSGENGVGGGENVFYRIPTNKIKDNQGWD